MHTHSHAVNTSHSPCATRSEITVKQTNHKFDHKVNHELDHKVSDCHVSIEQLSVTIGKKTVLNQINAKLKSGKITALLGPNGAGKSTLLKALCQEQKASQGRVLFHGKPLAAWNRMALAQSLAVLPQHASLSFPFTVQEVVAMGLYPLSLSHQQGQSVIEKQLDNVDLLPFKHRQYPNLSGGEKQRVQLARVLTQLTQSPVTPLLLLDEPTAALDLAQQHRVLQLMQTLAHEHGYTLVVVLHDLNQAVRYADELLVLHQGNIVSVGSPKHALNPDIIERVWGYKPIYFDAGNGEHPLIY